MKIKFVALSATILFVASAAFAQTTTTTSPHVWSDSNGWWAEHWNCQAERYNANEVSLDLFGSYLAGQRKIEDIFKTNIRHGFWGGGVGLNYFFLRELGIGGDIEIPDTNQGGNFVSNINGSLIGRLPIGNTGLAPYIFGGGGRQTEPVWQWTGFAGIGLEYRFNPLTGIFADTRYSWVDKTSDTILFRAGIRLAF